MSPRHPEASRQEDKNPKEIDCPSVLCLGGPAGHMGWEEGVTREGLDCERFSVSSNV